MTRNILIISSDYTGHGHKSIAEALTEQFSKLADINTHTIDGFSLGGNMGLKVGKLYGSVTRKSQELWKLFWELSVKKPELLRDITEFSISKSLQNLLGDFKPHLIVTLHPSFNGSVLNMLEANNLKIPLIPIVADLVSILPLWADARATCTICPTEEAKQKCMEFGVPESKLKVIGFPVRERFCRYIDGQSASASEHDNCKPLQCLIMSGGEGVGNMRTIAEILMKNFNCHVIIVCGRNEKLKNSLETYLSKNYGDRVSVYGFVKDIQELMYSSDIVFTRGSPNVMMEAVMCNVPLVITGALPGQEEGNPGYAEKYKLGVVCKDLRKLRPTVKSLLEDNAFKLNEIKRSQREYRNPLVTKTVTDFIISQLPH